MINKSLLNLLALAIASSVVNLAQAKSHGRTKPTGLCDALPPTVLSRVLGAAFNSRYMSIENPIDTTDLIESQHQSQPDHEHPGRAIKRKTSSARRFYVDDTYVPVMDDQPAWEVLTSPAESIGKIRGKRSPSAVTSDDIDPTTSDRDKRRSSLAEIGLKAILVSGERPWVCDSSVKWIDLGQDYYPRYLRTVECARKSCWYGHFVCRPRAFTVRVLRRRINECVATGSLVKIGVAGLPGDLRQLWVWEERALNFCCDCQLE